MLPKVDHKTDKENSQSIQNWTFFSIKKYHLIIFFIKVTKDKLIASLLSRVAQIDFSKTYLLQESIL